MVGTPGRAPSKSERTAAGAGAAVASLPMYDWPEVGDAIDALWSRIRKGLVERGLDAPERLTRQADYHQLWRTPNLMLSQTCGYPYVKDLRGRVRLVATPCYAAAGCEGPNYRSLILVRRDSAFGSVRDLAGATAVINSFDSQSGYSALRAVVAPHAGGKPFFRKVVQSGAHRASMRAVATGDADVCAIDAVCLALAERHDPQTLAELRILAASPQAPALPFITAGSRSDSEVKAIRAALADAMRDPLLAEVRAALFLDSICVLEDAAYDRIEAIAREAAVLGYPELV